MKSPKQTGLLVAALTLGITNLLLPALPTMAGTLMGAVVTTDGKPVALPRAHTETLDARVGDGAILAAGEEERVLARRVIGRGGEVQPGALPCQLALRHI